MICAKNVTVAEMQWLTFHKPDVNFSAESNFYYFFIFFFTLASV